MTDQQGESSAVPTLVISNADLKDVERGRIETLKNNGRTLGDGSERRSDDPVRDAVCEVLPRVVSERVQKIVPEGFQVGEISLKLSLGGKICGIGVDGDVSVKFVPRDGDGSQLAQS